MKRSKSVISCKRNVRLARAIGHLLPKAVSVTRCLRLALCHSLVLTVLLCVAQRAAGQSVKFGTATSYTAGAGPWAIVAGDFNGDSKPDLAVANRGSNNVSLLLGKGDGTFLSAVNYAVGTTPLAIAAGDFNHDGKLDLATANSDADSASVLLGNGDGTFQPAANYAVGKHPIAIVASDLNRDGQTDLAVANITSDTVSVLLSNGNLFQSAVNYPVGHGPQGLATGDFNGDGKTDLVTANTAGGSVSVMRGNGNGTFQTAIDSNAPSGPLGIAVGDFNRDGKQDVAVGTIYDPGAKILLGNGDGSFKPPVGYHLGNTPTYFNSGDFNGDGRKDLVSAGIFRGSNLQVLLGNSDGTFTDAGSAIDSVGALSIAVADFNRDTRPDLAAVVDSQVSVVLLNATPGNPDKTDYFVHQHYLDFLEREPDNGGFDYWTGQILLCANDPGCVLNRRIGTSAAFFAEKEFQKSGYFVYRLYRAAFARRPTYAEFTLDRPKVIGGQQLEASKTELANSFAQRDQFKQAYPDLLNSSDFVNRLFDAAGLTPFTTERQAAIASLDQGASRASVLQSLVENPTFIQREYNAAFVQMQYFGYLRRDEDMHGYDFWLGKMGEQPNNYIRMVCAFITSAEYQQRFSAAVTHFNTECGP